MLVAYNRQVRQLPGALQHRECGLIEIGRPHARNFDAGHFPSGGGMQRVLTELRRLAERAQHRPWPPQAVEDDPGLCGRAEGPQ
jgi:hypothetical protein